MLKQLRILFTGLFISFLGALPLGTQNIAAAQIAISDGIPAAMEFALGLIVADVFYIYITFRAMQWIQSRKRFFKALEWFTLLIAIALAIANFYAAAHPSAQKNVLLSNSLPKFLLGLFLNGINPVQIPFWFGWSTVLFTKKILQPRWRHYHLFAIGATVGFFAAILIFVFGGRLIADRIAANTAIVYYIIGGIFCITAGIQIWKMMRKKDVEHGLEHPEEITADLEGVVVEINKDEK